MDSPLASNIINSIDIPKFKSFNTLFPKRLMADLPQAKDLIEKLLIFNPNKRLTAKKALKHPYVIEFSSEDLDEDDMYFSDGKPA